MKNLVIYMGCLEEDQRMINKFGDDYRDYMKRVPRINFALGIVRIIGHKHKGGVEHLD